MASIITTSAGSAIIIRRTIPIIQGTGTAEKCWFTVKSNVTHPDAQAVIKKSITTTLTSSGHISDSGAGGSAVFSFEINAVDGAKLEAGKMYFFDIWMKTTLKDPTKVDGGVITVERAITLDRS